MKRRLTAEDRTPQVGDSLVNVAGRSVTVTSVQDDSFTGVGRFFKNPFDFPKHYWSRLSYVSRADGGSVLIEDSPPEQEYNDFTPRDPYDVD